MRIAFLGTPEFGVKSLEALVTNGYNVVGVFTQKDKPAGRNKTLVAPPVKVFAQNNNIPVFQLDKIRSEAGVEALKSLNIDLMVTAAFGQILSQENLDIPKLGCINVHGSLLPKYRGAAPIQFAIIKGEKTTGITTMFTDVGLDTGDMLVKTPVEILPDETAGELFSRMADIGAQTLLQTLEKLKANELFPEKQKEKQATYFPMLKKQDGKINWKSYPQEIHDFVRGMNPWPMAQSVIKGRKINIIKARLGDVETNINNQHKWGEVVECNPKTGFVVACFCGSIEILELQVEGKKAMSAKAFLLGNKIDEGDCFE